MGDAHNRGLDAPGGAASPPEHGSSPAPLEAFRIARLLVDDAERQAAAIVADAERLAQAVLSEAEGRARSCEREADLLVGRARRLLEAAEHKAEVIRRRAGQPVPEVIDLAQLTDPAAAPSDDAFLHRVVGRPAALRGSIGARVDNIVASAVAQAVGEALAGAERSADRSV